VSSISLFSVCLATLGAAWSVLAWATVLDASDQWFAKETPAVGQLSATGPIAAVNDTVRRPVVQLGAAGLALISLVGCGLQFNINARIGMAKTKAERANHSKSQFLAQMSHELRTPMTGIIGFTDCLLDSLTDSQQIASARAVKRNSEHLLRIVNEILDLAHVESGNLIVERTQCSPRRVVEQTVQLMQIEADAKGVRLVSRLEPGVPSTVSMDPGRVRQILLNVVGNAIKFTECGSVELTYRYIRAETGGRMEFAVTDSGAGIRPEDSGRIFQQFIQADGSIQHRFGGNGLGLSISRKLVKLMQGSLTLESDVDRGSTFTVSLPTPDARWTPAATRRHSLRQERESSKRIAAHVLLVDDCSDNRSLIKHLLIRMGLRVTLAEHGARALSLISGSQPVDFDLVLMDMQMPIMDGYTAVQRARELGFRLPIVALTAHAMSGDRRKCLDAGCDDYLTKPIDRQELSNVLRRNLRHLAQRPTQSADGRHVLS
jgi:signal transduction histidine kinase/CheY-like chemotaxis protein